MSKHRQHAALMIQGTGSNVGKSLITAGLCRAFVRKGLRVAPFKPQNMSNNAAVTPDGGEIGRAQALQAKACGLAPDVRMNPILLKPEAEQKAQLVVRGQVIGRYSAREYHQLKPQMLIHTLDAFHELAHEHELVLIEGAGSPAEVNLREGDVANMGFAEAADVPVMLVADIHRGGVIANLIGTHMLLEPSEQTRLVGYVINQFRGDPSLFTPACTVIEQHTTMPCLGIVPYFPQAANLPAEDAMEIPHKASDDGKLTIAVPRLPRIANFDDLDPLSAEPSVNVKMIEAGNPLPRDADIILLPGSKATLSDMEFLRNQGWDIDIRAHLRQGGAVVGICAGFQMLGETLRDPDRIEGDIAETPGLGLLRVDTVMAKTKHLKERQGFDHLSQTPVSGYEMHMGETSGSDCATPMLYLDDTPYGARNHNGLVMGCYLHGLFNSDTFRRCFLQQFMPHMRSQLHYNQQLEEILDSLAEHLEEHIDLEKLPL